MTARIAFAAAVAFISNGPLAGALVIGAGAGYVGAGRQPRQPARAQGVGQQRMRDEVLKVLSLPSIKEKLAATGLEVPDEASTPEEMMQSNLKDYDLAGQILRSVNYKPE